VLIDTAYLYLLLTVFLPLCYVWIPATQKAPKDRLPWYDILLALLSTVVPFYFAYNHVEMMQNAWESQAPMAALVFATILWVLMIEAGRRAAGPAFAIVIFFFSTYPLFSYYLPGFLHSTSFSFTDMASFYAMNEQGIVGLVLRVFGRLVIGFIVFAVVVQNLGAGKFFNDLAIVLVGKTRAANAKVAIFASGVLGSISGAAVGNVIITGSFTIPAMKSLYYLSLFLEIDSFAARAGLKPQPMAASPPPILQTLVKNLHIILGFSLLLFVLFILRLSSQSPWIATVLVIVLAMFRKETRLTPRRLAGLIEDIGRTLGELIGIMGSVGIIIGAFILTGLAYSIPNEIIALAGGSVYVALLFGALASFILGMGVTISACYVFLAIVLAPGLVKSGFDPMAVHLFILYYGMLSFITPPVAVAAFAAASVAGANPMKTGIQAMKLGIIIYILPFIFVLHPALILRGPIKDILVVIPTAVIALIIISSAIGGYFWRLGNLTIITRLLFLGAGILLIIPGLSTDIFGLCTFVLFFTLSYMLRGRSPVSKLFVIQAQTQEGSSQLRE